MDDRRAQVLAYAQRHGPKAAAAKFHIPVGTIWSWRARERRRAAQQQVDQERAAVAHTIPSPVPGPSPAQEFTDRAAELADRYRRGACLGCGGAGLVRIPPVTRGGLLIRRARTIPCPTCGGVPVRIQVNELPRAEWAEGMARAGDMGVGWTPEEWAERQAGNPNPRGWRWTHLDRIQVGPDGPVGPGERRPRRRG
jgi:hypothetical protein